MRRFIARRLLISLVAMAGAVAIPGCNFTTANISSLVVSKDKQGTQAADKFNPHETIYAKATLSNVPSKITVKWRVVAVKVEGEKDNSPIEGLDRSFDLPSDGTSSYQLSPPENGIPTGTYRIEAHMLTDGGEEKDLKSATVSVAAD